MAGEENTPKPTTGDAYDIGVPDPEPATETPGTGGAAAAPGEVESPPAPAVPQPRDPVTQRFIKHPKYLVRQARKLGIQDDEIEEMETDALGEAVGQALHWALEDSRRQPQQSAPEPATPPEDAIDWGTDADGRTLTESDYAPAVSGLVKANHSQEKRIKQLEQQVQQLLQSEGGRQAESAHDRLDRVFSGLTDLHTFIGGGSRHELDAEGPEMARRQAVIDQARRMAGGEKATWPQLLAKVPAAARALFGGAPATPRGSASDAPPPEPSQDIARWNNGATAKPTHRVGPPEQKGRSAAVRKVAQVLKERGQLGEEVSDEDFPG